MTRRTAIEARLPFTFLQRASLRGSEYGWRIADIPMLINAAHELELLNVGGFLQFRIPEKLGGGACDCYWVSVNTYTTVEKDLFWPDRVAKTAKEALSRFLYLKSKYDFLREGMNEFGDRLSAAEKQGANIADLMWFVWYAVDAKEEALLDRQSKWLSGSDLPPP